MDYFIIMLEIERENQATVTNKITWVFQPNPAYVVNSFYVYPDNHKFIHGILKKS